MKTKQKPVLVQHPETGHFVNVRPFFNLIFESNSHLDGLPSMAYSIEKTIRFANLNLIVEPDTLESKWEQINFFTTLYEFKDLINETSIIERK